MSLTNDQITAKNFQAFYNAISPGLNNASYAGSTPVGTIIAIMGKEAPLNYLICNGSEYNIVDYLELANYFEKQFESCNFFGGDGTTTFAVPDLRGEFLRGAGTNSHTDQGSGGDVGDHQDATLPDFEARMSFHGAATATVLAGIGGNAAQTIQQRSQYRPGGANTSGASSHDGISIKPSLASSVYVDGAEARPTNTSILYCIKAKSNDAYNHVVNVSFEDYSEQETVIGKWIDGKPLYQKTVNVGAMPNNTTKTIDSGLTNENVVNLFGHATNPNGVVLPLPYVDISSNSTIQIHLSYLTETHSIRLMSGTDRSTFSSGYVTLQYTKTTDAVNSFVPSLLTNYKSITSRLPNGLMNEIIVTKTNENPGNYLLGTWELVDKHLKDYNGAVTFTKTAYISTVQNCQAILTNNVLYLMIGLTNGKALNDDQAELGSINVSTLGITGNVPKNIYISAIDDGGNAVILAWIGGSWTLYSTDTIGTRPIATNTNIWMSVTIGIPMPQRNDEYCDKFYWKRVSEVIEEPEEESEGE